MSNQHSSTAAPSSYILDSANQPTSFDGNEQGDVNPKPLDRIRPVCNLETQMPTLTTDSVYASQPDGGLVAWLLVFGAWVLFFNTWGAMNSFGVFQTYYESGVLFDRSSSDIAWIGSIQTFCLQAMGLVAGPLY